MVPAVGVEPTWSRLKGGHAAATSRWRRMAVGPGFEPGSFRLTAGRVTSCHHPTTRRRPRSADRRGFDASTWREATRSSHGDHDVERMRGRQPRSAGPEAAVLPLNDLSMVGSGGVEPPRTCARGRWATDYPTTPNVLVRLPGLEPGLGGPQSPVLPFTPQSRRYSSVKSGSR